MGEIFEEAVNPEQYDLQSVDWGIWNNELFYYHELIELEKTWKGKKVLDVGCGTGWLFKFFAESGAKSIEGIDPSKKNVSVARKLYPKVKIYETTLQDFDPGKKYDIVTSLMAFNHFANVQEAFQIIFGLLADKGELQIVVPDPKYTKKERFNYHLSIEKINNKEYAVRTDRKNNSLADVIRDLEVYEKAAQESGFKIIEKRKIVPSQRLMEESPKYRYFKGKAIAHLIRFRKGLKDHKT